MANNREEIMELGSIIQIEKLMNIDGVTRAPSRQVILLGEWKAIRKTTTLIGLTGDEEKVRELRIRFARERQTILDLMFRIFHDSRIIDLEDQEAG
jgi:hypothetical protein